MKYTPDHSLRKLQRELDSTFGTFFPQFGTGVNVFNDFVKDFSPQLDVVDTGDTFRLSLDLPGVNKEDVEINLHDGILTIRGERHASEITETESEIRSERSFGSFSRSFRLPSEIKEKKISARLENGVLFVELPKAEETKPQAIKIS